MEQLCLHKNEKGDLGNEPIEFSFNGTFPCPKELYCEDLHTFGGIDKKKLDKRRAEMTKKYGYASAYDWHCAEWGTKWDACEVNIDYSNETDICYSFSTAWSPLVLG